MTGFLERELLLAPDLVARAAAALAQGPEQRWMLGQPLAVRRSYLREVMEGPAGDAAQQAWMLRQPDAVRLDYVRVILAPRPEEETRAMIWMLRQPEAVRRSYVAEVLRVR